MSSNVVLKWYCLQNVLHCFIQLEVIVHIDFTAYVYCIINQAYRHITDLLDDVTLKTGPADIWEQLVRERKPQTCCGTTDSLVIFPGPEPADQRERVHNEV
jgi:hypothetical protein